ncbi:hypothetical protein P2H44_14875 [Albimonas sp. CAU 1670]|uniref:hypothetical protein n=1 Tax=Albimonas sp. CAU 1670 TaxID=3032599 RepID=UPI0023DBE0B4|nr:hypothetical protein [Albimonas sp. CAU 1670]MDF2233842.1 hypothetical protein [Albimonas sp. CAU 1670]
MDARLFDERGAPTPACLDLMTSGATMFRGEFVPPVLQRLGPAARAMGDALLTEAALALEPARIRCALIEAEATVAARRLGEVEDPVAAWRVLREAEAPSVDRLFRALRREAIVQDHIEELLWARARLAKDGVRRLDDRQAWLRLFGILGALVEAARRRRSRARRA